jgi:Mlc titration factor MtfA (ptsG expression regulator)/RimJ/RimL family protein N-acetyltransferase
VDRRVIFRVVAQELSMSARTKLNASRRELLSQSFPTAWEAWLSANMFHYRLLNDPERARLHDDTRVLVAEKTWEGCDGLKVTEMMKLTVAAQASLLLLGIEHDYFSRAFSIVLFPADFELPAESWQKRGRVIAGRAVDYGSVFLSWERVLAEARDPATGHNLVIHEFAHQLDFLDGYTNGTPPLRSREQTQLWQRVMQENFERLRRDVQMGARTFLGSYAATRPTEFFSVVSERFFTQPEQLRQCHPELFEVLAEYYQVTPLIWFERQGAPEPAPLLSPIPDESAGDQVEAVSAPQPFESDFVDFGCPYCNGPVSFPTAAAGTLKQCPNCLESMIVPDAAGQPAHRIPFPIRTERLVLRQFQTLDAKDLADLMSNPDTLRYVEWTAMNLEEVEEWIANQHGIRFPHSSKYCHLAVEDVQAGKVAGLATLWFRHNAFELAQFEIIIHPNSQRKGYATEAIHGLLRYAFNGLRVRRLVAMCDGRNLPARALLVKSGLRQESECIQDHLQKGEWVNTVGFAVLKQEYESRQREQ